MLFLNMENQLLLILVLTFSFWLFVSAIAIRFQPLKTRAFGMAFIVPLLLTCASFLVSTYNKVDAVALFVVSHVLLLINCTSVMLFNKNSDSLKVFPIVPYILLGIGFYLSTMTIYPHLFWTIRFLVLVTLVVNLVLLINTLFQIEKDQMMGYACLFILSFSMGLILMYDEVSMEALFLMALGYFCGAVYVYKNSLLDFFKNYMQTTEALKRMNYSIQTEVIKRVEMIERSNRKLLEKSKTDSMTGLFIKSAILEKLTNFIDRSPKSTLSLLMFDIDHFKHINDTMGHQIGDQCIRSLAGHIQTSFRKDDILGRYGGDEFIVLLPDTTAVKAFLIADRFRELIQTKSNPSITISVGISNFPSDGKTVNELIDAADKALYTSKEKGRNIVTLFSNLQ
ncbi:MAG: GGDEF domain-containing protein [Acetivibrionales bacterium]|jgi:diguanylate cyclase (GGDEF)-like protein